MCICKDSKKLTKKAKYISACCELKAAIYVHKRTYREHKFIVFLASNKILI